ncbi:MAG: DUF4258 domain-containing protein [Nanoarchaeota archaeon]
MKIVFTLHLKEQMKERKLEKVWIEETIKSPDETRKKGHKYYAIKKLNGNTLKVAYVKEKYIKVLTAFFLK